MLYKTVLHITLIVLVAQALAQSSGKMSVQDYINTYKDIAVKEMKKHKIPASITLAQGILESRYGNSDLATIANNHFGIKCHSDWTGKTFIKDDDEKDECFRKYKKVERSFTDHSDFLVNRSRYAFLFEYRITDYKKWAKGLKKAGYATDPAYAHRLIKIIKDHDLSRYDIKQKVKKELPALSDVSQNNRIKSILTKEGDTPSKIADKYDIRLGKILQYNDLEDDTPLKPGKNFYLQPKRNRSFIKYHDIKATDNMYTISQKYGIKLSALYALNKMNFPDEPAIGEKMYLSKIRDAVPKIRDRTVNKINTNKVVQYYTIQQGETLYSIAKKFHVSVEELRKINAIESDTIHPGNKLQIIIKE